MRYPILMAGFAVLMATAPAVAFGLTDTDHAYLSTQGVERASALLRDLSPREQARLHALINDAATAHDPATRERSVAAALATFREHQAWEEAHPGELWDVPKQ